MDHEVVCFECLQPVEDPPLLNVKADGENCSSCAARMLDNLPGIFHTPFEEVAEEVAEAPEAADDSDVIEFQAEFESYDADEPA